MHDVDFLKQFTDAPILVRTDTLQYLDLIRNVVPDFKFPTSRKLLWPYSSAEAARCRTAGGMMVWDLNKKQAVPLHREQVG